MVVSRGRGLAAGSSRPLRSLRRGGGQRGIRYPRFRGAGSIKFRRLLRRCYAPGAHDLAARPPPQYCQPPPQPSEPARSSNPPLWRRIAGTAWGSSLLGEVARTSQIAAALAVASFRRLGTTAWSRLCIWIFITRTQVVCGSLDASRPLTRRHNNSAFIRPAATSACALMHREGTI